MEKPIEIEIISSTNVKPYRNDHSIPSKISLDRLEFHSRIFSSPRSERVKSHSPADKDIERVIHDLLDRVVKKEEEESKATTGNALSLLQNFVTKQTPASTRHSDLNNNNYDDNENTNISHETASSASPQEELAALKSNENPLVSLEKMLSYPSTTIPSLSSTMNNNGTMTNLSNNSIMTIKKKKFDKYRLFAEKMLRSTLS